MKRTTVDELVAFLSYLGVESGGVLLIHSDVRSLGFVERGLDGILDALRQVVGSEGTLIVPTFTFSFCKGEVFDVQVSPSVSGVLTEAVRNHPAARRSVHALHSFAALGPAADTVFTLGDKTSFGPGSVFTNLLKHRAQVLLLGIFRNTFVHYVEQRAGVEYRYSKDFRGIVRDGVREYEDCFSFYVRREGLAGTDEADRLPVYESIFTTIAHSEHFKYGIHRLFTAEDYCDVLSTKLAEDPLYLVDKQKYLSSAE